MQYRRVLLFCEKIFDEIWGGMQAGWLCWYLLNALRGLSKSAHIHTDLEALSLFMGFRAG